MKKKELKKCLKEIILRAENDDQRAKRLLRQIEQYKPVKVVKKPKDDEMILRDGDVIDCYGNIITN